MSGYIAVLIKKEDGSKQVLKANSLQELRHKRSDFCELNKNVKYLSTNIIKTSSPLDIQLKATIKGVKNGR